MTAALEHRGFAFLNILSPCVTWKGEDQFKELRGKLRKLPEDHDRSDRLAALSFTRETDTLTAGVLFETSEPSLLDRMEEIRRKALELGAIASTRELLESFVPRFAPAAEMAAGEPRGI